MGKIEDRLWADLMREPGAGQVLAVQQPLMKNRSIRASLATGGALALIAAVVAVLLLTAGTRTTPAYAVTVNRDGSVTLTVTELVGVRGANEQMAKLGVPVVVATVEPGCVATGEVVESTVQEHDIVEVRKLGEGFDGQRWIIHPSGIPAGDTVQISVQYVAAGQPSTREKAVGLAGAWGIFRGRAPLCRPAESNSL